MRNSRFLKAIPYTATLLLGFMILQRLSFANEPIPHLTVAKQIRWGPHPNYIEDVTNGITMSLTRK